MTFYICVFPRALIFTTLEVRPSSTVGASTLARTDAVTSIVGAVTVTLVVASLRMSGALISTSVLPITSVFPNVDSMPCCLSSSVENGFHFFIIK